MKKILYVATVVKTHIMEFHIPYLKMLKEMGWETAVAARNDYDNPNDCVIPYCDTYFDIPFERNPLKPRNIKAYRELKRVIDEGNYDIIHCHTPVGAMLTRLAARNARKKGTKVIYTAHGFHFYKGAPIINWLLYYPVEKYLSYFTDVLITINKEDYNRAKSFKARKVVYIPGVGIDIDKFSRRIGNRQEKREKLGLKENDFVLLSVGELIVRKNHALVFDALGELKKKGELDHIQYVICGQGPLEQELKKKTTSLGISENIHFLGYRNDISEICNASDLFIFMSLQEGLPVALMEAMACGLPVICSNIRGNTDLVENGKSGEIVENTADEVAKAIIRLKNNEALRNRYSKSEKSVIKHYDLLSIEEEIRDIYTDELVKTQRWGGVKPEYLLQVILNQKLKKELKIPVGGRVLLSVGEVNKNKNHRVGIEALAKVNDVNAYYVICGSGPLIESHMNLAKSLGVSDRVIFAGYRTDVVDFYKMADIFLFPSLREGLPVALMEAMACGLPIICSNIRGNTDLIEDKKEGLIVENNPEDIARAIESIQKNKKLQEELTIAAYQKIKKFDLNCLKDEVARIYRSEV